MYLSVFLIPIPDDLYLKYTLLPEPTMFSLLVLCKNSLGSLDFWLAKRGKNYTGLTSPQSLKMSNFQNSKHHREQLDRKPTKI